MALLLVERPGIWLKAMLRVRCGVATIIPMALYGSQVK
jgi:hypothetical protein